MKLALSKMNYRQDLVRDKAHQSAHTKRQLSSHNRHVIGGKYTHIALYQRKLLTKKLLSEFVQPARRSLSGFGFSVAKLSYSVTRSSFN